jgi:hypothetical protein
VERLPWSLIRKSHPIVLLKKGGPRGVVGKRGGAKKIRSREKWCPQEKKAERRAREVAGRAREMKGTTDDGGRL